MEILTKKRLIAFIIDFLVITALMWILSTIIYPLVVVTRIYFIYNYSLIILSIIIILYFTYLEKAKTSTLGKNIMGIKVVAVEGELNYSKTLIRNLSKILWFPLIVDVLGGYLKQNSSLRIMEDISKTKVILNEYLS